MYTNPSIFKVFPTCKDPGPYTFSSASYIIHNSYQNLLKNSNSLLVSLILDQSTSNGSLEFQHILMLFLMHFLEQLQSSIVSLDLFVLLPVLLVVHGQDVL